MLGQYRLSQVLEDLLRYGKSQEEVQISYGDRYKPKRLNILKLEFRLEGYKTLLDLEIYSFSNKYRSNKFFETNLGNHISTNLIQF
mgnify:CR=1 FL=1